MSTDATNSQETSDSDAGGTFWRKTLHALAVSFVVACVLALIIVALVPQLTRSYYSSSELENKYTTDWYENLQEVYRTGSFDSAECLNKNPGSEVVTDRYNPEQTRKILDESGLMDGTARIVGASGFVGGRSYRYEPEHATRPTIRTSTDNLFQSKKSRQCIMDIIE